MRDYYLLIITRKIANPVYDNQLEDFPETITCVLPDTDGYPLKFRRIFDLEAYITSGEGVSDLIEEIEEPFFIYPINSGNHLHRELIITEDENRPMVIENAYL